MKEESSQIMCGIAGIWGNDAAADSVEQMVSKMMHRGPDGASAHVDGQAPLSFGHCRLAIMDPTGGAQPLYSEDGSLVLIANGEIYNSPGLRDALAPDHRFATRTDSETILHLFEERGQATAVELDGMFAFALSDGDSFFLARDPIGIKPLYYSWQKNQDGDDSLVFASEVKALADDFDAVQEFPAGTYYSSDAGFVSYYDVPELTSTDLSVDEHARRLRRTLEEAVSKRLMSDVPLGAFLSGGLDSSIIAAIARQSIDELHTFSVGVEGAGDVEAARLMAAHIGSVHHEYLYYSR